jgi:hypothetical protein
MKFINLTSAPDYDKCYSIIMEKAEIHGYTGSFLSLRGETYQSEPRKVLGKELASQFFGTLEWLYHSKFTEERQIDTKIKTYYKEKFGVCYQISYIFTGLNEVEGRYMVGLDESDSDRSNRARSEIWQKLQDLISAYEGDA